MRKEIEGMNIVEKSEMELLYESYLKRDDLIINIDTRKYYRIVQKQYLSVCNGLILVTLPRELFGKGKTGRVVDENDRVFELGGPVLYRFGTPIPDWDIKTVTVTINTVKDTDSIGDYFSIYTDDNK